jgi:hypothetical protein
MTVKVETVLYVTVKEVNIELTREEAEALRDRLNAELAPRYPQAQSVLGFPDRIKWQEPDKKVSELIKQAQDLQKPGPGQIGYTPPPNSYLSPGWPENAI